MQVVQFPSDVVDSSEHIQLSLEVLHCVPIALGRDVSSLLQLAELEVDHVELPQVVHPVFRVLAAEHEHVLAVSRCRAPAPRHRSSFVTQNRTLLGLLRSLEQDRHLVLGDVELVHGVEVLGLGSVPAADDDDQLVSVFLQVHAAEGVDFRQGLADRVLQSPGCTFRVEAVDFAGRAHVSVEPADEVDAVLGADEGVFGARPRQVAFGFDGLPVELLDIILKVDGIEISHIAFEDLVSPIDIHFLIQCTGSAITSNLNILSYDFTLSPSFAIQREISTDFDFFRSLSSHPSRVIIFDIAFVSFSLEELNIFHPSIKIYWKGKSLACL